MGDDADRAMLVSIAHRPPKRTQRGDVDDLAAGKVTEQMAGLVGHLDTGQKIEAVTAAAVQLQRRARCVGTVMIGYREHVEIGRFLDVPEQFLDRLVPIPPGIVPRVGMQIGLSHHWEAVSVYDERRVVLGAVVKTATSILLTPATGTVRDPRPSTSTGS